MAELTYFSVISRVDGSSGKRRITIHPKIEGGPPLHDVHQVNEGGPPDTGDGANLFSSRGRACDAKKPRSLETPFGEEGGNALISSEILKLTRAQSRTNESPPIANAPKSAIKRSFGFFE
jgi:hypothetical protein